MITRAYAGNRRILESEFFIRSRINRAASSLYFFNQSSDERRQNFFAGFFVDVRKIIRQVPLNISRRRSFQRFSPLKTLGFGQIVRQNFYFALVSTLPKRPNSRRRETSKNFLLLGAGLLDLGQPITAHNHVLGRVHDGVAVSGLKRFFTEAIMPFGFRLGLPAERYMYGHLAPSK